MALNYFMDTAKIKICFKQMINHNFLDPMECQEDKGQEEKMQLKVHPVQKGNAVTEETTVGFKQ
jgi:hypothetical protein